MSDDAAPAAPVGLLAELTHRCPLQCPYCSNPRALEQPGSELPTGMWVDVVAQAADLGVLQLHLSGGEPTARRDLEAIVARAATAGLYSNLITSGVTLDRRRIEALAAAGLDHVQISMQDVHAPNADRIARMSGAHARKLEAAHLVRAAGLPLTLNAPIHRQNIGSVVDFIGLAVELGAQRLEIAHVQYYGWALANRAALMPARADVLESARIVEAARSRLRGILVIDFVVPDYYAVAPKPCMGGWGRRIINVTPSGMVLPSTPPKPFRGCGSTTCASEACATSGSPRKHSKPFAGRNGCRSRCNARPSGGQAPIPDRAGRRGDRVMPCARAA